jgi:hypothetical protein
LRYELADELSAALARAGMAGGLGAVPSRSPHQPLDVVVRQRYVHAAMPMIMVAKANSQST